MKVAKITRVGDKNKSALHPSRRLTRPFLKFHLREALGKNVKLLFRSFVIRYYFSLGNIDNSLFAFTAASSKAILGSIFPMVAFSIASAT